jgi:hypothetical protein
MQIQLPIFFFFLPAKQRLLKDSKISTLEAQRVSLFHKLKQVDISQLSKKPNASSWSVLHVVEHLVLIEEQSVANVLYKVQTPDSLYSVNLRTRVNLVLLHLVLGKSFKFKSPKVVAPEVTEQKSLEELELRWVSARKKLEEISKMSPDVLRKGIFKHPIVGYMNFSQMLGFYSAHLKHHLSQISGLIESQK